MEPDTLEQWMSEAGVNAKDGTEGFWVVFSSNLEISVGYISDADVVVCFAPILELEGLNDAQRLAVLSRSRWGTCRLAARFHTRTMPMLSICSGSSRLFILIPRVLRLPSVILRRQRQMCRSSCRSRFPSRKRMP